MKETSNISSGDEYQKDHVKVNQVTLDISQHVENVMTTEARNQPKTEQRELIWEQKQPEGVGMREYNFHQ